MKSKAKTVTIIIISLLVGIAIGIIEVQKTTFIKYPTNNSATKLQNILQLINERYVDKVNLDTLTDEAITSILSQLDPHSVYLTVAQVRKESENLNGNFEGIGIQFRIVEDTIVVIQPLKGGPSYKVGIMAGDRIVKINDSLWANKNIDNDNVLKLLKGKKGTKVKLSIKRNGLSKLLDFYVLRDVITTNSVDYFGMLNENTGYIKLNEFSASSANEVSKALYILRYDHGMTQLIFDLRGNGGGYLQEAVAIADEFLPKGDLIVFTKGRNGTKENKSFATSGGLFEKGKMIVLIDEVSASASEILAGALQDNDRATIAGRRTFGKGLVQEQILLTDSSAIRLTVSRYYTPSGRCIQRPYVSNDPEQYYADFITRYANMEKNADTISHVDSLLYKTKNGRTVYGGGGIEPDIDFPYHNYKRSESYSELLRFGLIYKFCFEYADKNRKDFTKYSNGKQFISQFNINSNLYNQFLMYAKNNNCTPRLSEKEIISVKTLIKSYIGQIIFDDETFYSIFLTMDEDVQKALTKF
ncbi:MAG: S41 family peptidase [Bacteroidales bacterium]|jgi:carboxyl-terminal processing protease|nr:S41 family peptidase [Bacteroidales bacterium]